jgi:hypothetical protein
MITVFFLLINRNVAVRIRMLVAGQRRTGQGKKNE